MQKKLFHIRETILVEKWCPQKRNAQQLKKNYTCNFRQPTFVWQKKYLFIFMHLIDVAFCKLSKITYVCMRDFC